MSTYYSLHVVHPGFELLKRSAKILHFIAGAAILANAVHEWQVQDSSAIIYIAQGIIGIDIIILVFFTGNILVENPRLNVIFRLIESVALLGICFSMLMDAHYILSVVYLAAAFGYFMLVHKEIRVLKEQEIFIKSTGISIPNLLKDVEISWVDVKQIIPKYHSIIIETLKSKKIEFDLSKNLKIDELEQINDFCTKHLVIR
jgi:hypothetical protein